MYIHCLAKRKLSFRFKSANCSVIIWGCYSSSGLRHRPGYPINGFFLPWWLRHIHRALVVKEWSMRTHEFQGAWGVIFTHELATTESSLYPIKSLWDVLEKPEGMVRLSCHLGKKWMQLWMEINVVRLHKIVETMPQQMRSVIKAKGGPTKCNFFFGQAVYILYKQILSDK